MEEIQYKQLKVIRDNKGLSPKTPQKQKDTFILDAKLKNASIEYRKLKIRKTHLEKKIERSKDEIISLLAKKYGSNGDSLNYSLTDRQIINNL